MKKISFFLLISMLLLLAGCSSHSMSLTTRPCGSDPAEIAANELSGRKYNPANLCIPENRVSSSALVDCNGDGTDELIVCTREKRSDSWEVSLHVFSLYKDEYKNIYSVSREGKSIDKLDFAHLENGTTGIVFEYSLASSGLHDVLICTFQEGHPVTAYTGTCSELTVFDIDNNGVDDILIANAGSDTECGSLQLLRFDGDVFEAVSSAPLSAGLLSIDAISAGNIGFKLPAVICEGYIKGNGYVTDCVICENGELRNLFISDADTVSYDTLRPVCIWSKDIDSDGCIEIPCPSRMDSSENNQHWFINWLRPDVEGGYDIICTTYNDFDAGWYLILPDGAGDAVTCEVTLNSDGVRCSLFSSVNEEGIAQASQWAVYEFTGNMPYARLINSGFVPAATAYDRAYSISSYNSLYSDKSIASGLFISDEHIEDYPGL